MLGLEAGSTLEIPIVVIAEDGVTSNTYYVKIFRAVPPPTPAQAPTVGLNATLHRAIIQSSKNAPAPSSADAAAADSPLPAGKGTQFQI